MDLLQLRQQPFDPNTHLVYADTLQEAGDLRGSLIAVQHSLQSRPHFTEITKLQHAAN